MSRIAWEESFKKDFYARIKSVLDEYALTKYGASDEEKKKPVVIAL